MNSPTHIHMVTAAKKCAVTVRKRMEKQKHTAPHLHPKSVARPVILNDGCPFHSSPVVATTAYMYNTDRQEGR